MPVKLLKEEKSQELVQGQYFFAGSIDHLLYCSVLDDKCTSAHVINGNFEIRLDAKKRTVQVPYTGRVNPLPILYVGAPEVPDPNDWREAIHWAEGMLKKQQDAVDVVGGKVTPPYRRS